MKISPRRTWVYSVIALASVCLGILISYTSLATQLDNDIYDFLFRLNPAPLVHAQSALLVVDEETLAAHGGMRNIRNVLARVLPAVARARPKLIAIDLTLTDVGDDAEDAALESAMAASGPLVLACEMMPDASRWQEPLERFRIHAAAVGHAGALPSGTDAVNREIPLERVAGRVRRWALALEAFRISEGADQISSSPTDLVVGQTTIVSRWDQGRPMRIRFRSADAIPRISLLAVEHDPNLANRLAGKAVFVGVTAQSAARDRLLTPISASMPMLGVEIHAQAFETLAHRDFLDDVPLLWPLLLAILFCGTVAVIFSFLQGWPAYATGLGVLVVAHATPALLFRSGLVLPPTGPITSAWFAILGCASWQYFAVRKALARSESDRARYQQAIQFVTHEMRTPLTAIQGSSELMTRYNLPEEKRKQIGQMINSESKRLAQMITTFLNVEKLSAGHLEIKRLRFPVAELMRACAQRARSLADRKQIEIVDEPLDAADVEGDPELLEYAVYNLITNAIKYSPEKTRITLSVEPKATEVRVAVRDQGYGMDEKEVKQVFTKFFRAGSAAKSGEIGTGIGLSIVDEIVTHHGGTIQVTSKPGEGSCFTIILPVRRKIAGQPETAAQSRGLH